MMRTYHAYTPDQAFLLPPALTDLIAPDDPVHVVRQVVRQLNLRAIHQSYRCERGRPPFHPEAMVGLLLYGACRGIYSSRKLAQACRDNVTFMYLTGRLEPDFHTIAQFRQRFRKELQEIFRQVLQLCRRAGLVRLGHVSLDGTKVRANASKHKAMSYGRMLSKERELEEEIERWLEEGERQDAEEDEAHGPDDDGYSLPKELRESQKRLETIRAAKKRLEREARRKAEREGREPKEAAVSERAQSNFTDPDSRIMQTQDGFQQCYNAQVAVDAESQVVVACEVSRAPPDVERLRPMLDQIVALNGKPPKELTADAGYASEANFAALEEANVHALIALRRYHHDEPPDADPAPARSTNDWPHRNEMRRRLSSPAGKALYKLRKQTVEPVIGQIKGARGFRQFLCRSLTAVQAEWSLVCTAHNLLKLHKALATA
ncbi:MAG: IS1182 family transposase [Anaerolineae bacterium]